MKAKYNQPLDLKNAFLWLEALNTDIQKREEYDEFVSPSDIYKENKPYFDTFILYAEDAFEKLVNIILQESGYTAAVAAFVIRKICEKKRRKLTDEFLFTRLLNILDTAEKECKKIYPYWPLNIVGENSVRSTKWFSVDLLRRDGGTVYDSLHDSVIKLKLEVTTPILIKRVEEKINKQIYPYELGILYREESYKKDEQLPSSYWEQLQNIADKILKQYCSKPEIFDTWFSILRFLAATKIIEGRFKALDVFTEQILKKKKQGEAISIYLHEFVALEYCSYTYGPKEASEQKAFNKKLLEKLQKKGITIIKSF